MAMRAPLAARLRALGGAALAALLLAATLLAVPPATAADTAPAPAAEPAPADPAAAPAPDPDAPVFFGTVYVWGSALDGTASTLPPLPAVGVDLSFGDVLENLNGALMGAAEMRLGRWSVIGDVMFTQVTPSGTLPGRLGATVEVRSRSLMVEGDVLYRLYQSTPVDFDAGAGLRFWNLDNRLTIRGGRRPGGLDYSVSERWIDPVLAGRVTARLGGPWSATAVGDIGGFSVGSRLTWQAIGTVNYQWNDNLALRAGYRALSVDYQNGDFLYDVVMHGPIVGLTYRF